MTVLAATPWPTNGHLIADCAELGYLHEDWLTLDPTYGRGIWWKQWRPRRLVTSDLSPLSVESDMQADFTHLPFASDTFDAVVYDPPYVCVGGRKTTGIGDLHSRYGLTDAPRTPADLQDLICDGLAECHRVLKSRGILLCKCQDYVSSGKLWPGTHYTLQWALILGLQCVDRLEHIAGVRPQPPGRRQVHARRNLSTLFVLRKP